MSELLHRDIEVLSYAEVAELDPLDVDGIMTMLPGLNERGDLDAIRAVTVCATESTKILDTDDKSVALAMLRDLDFLASSMVRHGENPIDTVDGLESQLIRLGEITGTIPRGTVFTYAAANPTGERRRSFTGSVEEEAFIDAVSQGVHKLDAAVDRLGAVSLFGDRDADLARALDTSTDAMQQMVASIVAVKRAVSPDFFTFQMRPYFDPLVIGGKEYTGAGGAQMQLLALDYMLWGCADTSSDYVRFYEENYQYLTPAQQQAIARYSGVNDGISIVDYLSQWPAESPVSTRSALANLKVIRKFRHPHRRVAQENFKIRSDDAVGSGAYRPDILDVLITKTDDAIARLESGQES